MLVHVLSAGKRECQLRNCLLHTANFAILGSIFLNNDPSKRTLLTEDGTTSRQEALDCIIKQTEQATKCSQ